MVNVELWDKGSDMTQATNLGLGMGGDMSKATMGIRAKPDAVTPGTVTFEVLNASKDTIHEMIVAKLPDMTKPLPYIADEERVDEDRAGDLGEVSELDPGKSGALRIEMSPVRTSSTATSRATTWPGCGRSSRSSRPPRTPSGRISPQAPRHLLRHELIGRAASVPGCREMACALTSEVAARDLIPIPPGQGFSGPRTAQNQ